MEQLLFYLHYALLLLFGVAVSAAFSGIAATKKNLIRLLLLTALCGALQIAVYGLLGEAAVWQWYPAITHLPIILALRFLFGRHILSAAVATATAYLCCQPAKWVGLAAFAFTGKSQIELLVRIAVLLAGLAIILRWFAEKIARIYSHRQKYSWVFGITPVVYYLFDYAVGIYSSLWSSHHQVVIEFLPCFLCLGHLLFCAVYYREFELKREAEHKEQLLRVMLEQQARDVETIRRSEAEIRLLRHDLKLFLNSLSTCIENADKETARKLISGFSSRAEASSIKRFCQSDTLNYILSDYDSQCRENHIRFQAVVELAEIPADEVLFSSILANALDNALNAQAKLPPEKRNIHLMLRTGSGKTLLCIKNSFATQPVFQDGLPVTSRKGHGNGVISIQYATEKLGGNCQFCVEDDWFVLRVVI